MKPYTVYHLKHNELIKLEGLNKESRSEEQEAAVKAYVGLTSKLPRIDRVLKQSFGLNPLSMEELIEQKQETDEKNNAIKLDRQIQSSLMLLKLGYYEKVAAVETETAKEAIHQTMNINSYWRHSKNKNLDILNKTTGENLTRSTQTYDIVDRFGEKFLLMDLGTIDMKAGVYANELV